MRRALALITALAALALAAPAAGAADPRGAGRFQPGVTDFPTYPPLAVEAKSSAGDGIDWLDAGVGTAVGVGLGALAGAGLIALRRRSEPATA